MVKIIIGLITHNKIFIYDIITNLHRNFQNLLPNLILRIIKVLF